MTAVKWDQIGDRVYEMGLDRGMLYVEGQTGVAWNGLVSLDEKNEKTVESVYFSGQKINDIVTLGEFSGTLRSFTYPEEFNVCEGVLDDQTGVSVYDQPTKRFGMAYRVLVGDDVVGTDRGYKIHLLYNLTAVPAQRTQRTLSLDTTPSQFEWAITSIPEEIEGYRPTSHLVIDTRRMDPWLLTDLEEILYGSDDSEPRLPSLAALTTFIRKWDRFIVIDNNDGTWTAISRSDEIVMVSETEFSITTENAIYLDAVSYTLSSSDKNEEDF